MENLNASEKLEQYRNFVRSLLVFIGPNYMKVTLCLSWKPTTRIFFVSPQASLKVTLKTGHNPKALLFLSLKRTKKG